MSDSPSKLKFPCDPADIASLGLPPGDWVFSVDDNDLVMALPAGNFFAASNFAGKGFVMSPRNPAPLPDSCAAFFDGMEASAKSVLKILNSSSDAST